jgi:hypothetical protein
VFIHIGCINTYLPRCAKKLRGVIQFRNSTDFKGRNKKKGANPFLNNGIKHEIMIDKGGIASGLTTVGEEQKDKKSSKVQKKDKRLIEPELKKSRRFNMVLTEDEYINLLQNAQHSKTVTHYVIESCLSDTSRPYKMTVGLIEGIEKMTKELNAIGTNINQTTKHINFLMKHDLLSEDVFKRQQNDLLRYTNALIKVEDRLSKLIK